MAAIGPAPVWQIVPPSDHKDRMAQEGAASTPTGGYPLTDHGGSTIPGPKLAIVYLGAWWGDTAKLESFASDLMTAGYLQPLADHGYGSGQGTFIGAFHGPPVSGTVSDAQLQAALSAMISAGTVPAPDGHTLYALCLPDGVTSTQGGSSSCSSYCGYHDALSDGKTFYSVQPSTNCTGCDAPGTVPFDDFTAVLAHEIAEACTDAVPGSGWYNDATGMENADEWAWVFGGYGPWNVQGYQVNGIGNSLSVIKYQPQSNPNPPPSCTTAFWTWVRSLGIWAVPQSEAARAVEAPILMAQIHRYYPGLIGTVPIQAVATAPQPEGL